MCFRRLMPAVLASAVLVIGRPDLHAQDVAPEPVPEETAEVAEAAATTEAGDPAGAQLEPPPGPAPLIPRPQLQTRDYSISAARSETSPEGDYLLYGYVDIRYGDLRLQADFVRFSPDTGDLYAEGDILVDQAGMRLAGERIEFNVETGLGTLWEARGILYPDYTFEAARIEAIGDDKVRLYDAEITACTQPVPYWSFGLKKGTIHLDRYAYLHQVSLRALDTPAIYIPYLVWPVKSGRATGLLIPRVGSSGRRGQFLGNAFFWAIRRNMDATFYLDYFTESGLGYGAEYRFIPNSQGQGELYAYFIDEGLGTSDDVGNTFTGEPTPDERWRFHYEQEQKLGEWDLLVDINEVSDFDYYFDFERDLGLTTSSSTSSRIFLTRSWSSFNFNARAERRQQLLSFRDEDNEIVRDEVDQLILPEAELRLRSFPIAKIGYAPVYFSFETSIDRFNKSFTDNLERVDVTYGRIDAFPSLRTSFSPVSWLDITPSASVRATYWTDRIATDTDDQPTVLAGESLFRGLVRGQVDFLGPRLLRIYDTPQSRFSPRYKHTIEPKLSYSYSSGTDIDRQELLVFDEIDGTVQRVHQITYGVTTRLFAKRLVGGGYRPTSSGLGGFSQTGEALWSGGPLGTFSGASLSNPQKPRTEVPTGDEEEQRMTTEIASFDLTQSFSFLRPLRTVSRSSGTGDTRRTLEDDSYFSDITASFRFNPTPTTSLNIRSTYDVLFDTVSQTNLSGNIRGRYGFANLSWTLRSDETARSLRDLLLREALPADSVVPFDSNQLVFSGGTRLLRQRLSLDATVSYDAEEDSFRDQRYRIGYQNQCCAVMFEYGWRRFIRFGSSADFDEVEREYRIAFSLKGIGNFLDLHERRR